MQTEKKSGVTSKWLLNSQNLKKRLVSLTVSYLGLGLSRKIAKYTALSAALLENVPVKNSGFGINLD